MGSYISYSGGAALGLEVEIHLHLVEETTASFVRTIFTPMD
jgi:hypothetical protein